MAPSPTPLEETTVDLLQGEVCMQYTRCGKATCKCREGNLHGPYYYRVWREGSYVRKEYVRRENVAQTQAACSAYRAMLDRLRDSRLRRNEIEKSIRREWRRTKVWRTAKMSEPETSPSDLSPAA